ncbi:[protein-PII] uridylyltransferase [Planctopirus hydrillae]|uniref:Bifunctional uridylyltransferase/uridylyl-removing enzyme n=1 Tax=Planctopirus hydrillae TaxID=1841610 RepID=A0A1C3E3V9_9PLAN|nr:[protein-PII] uridylyltransferase [Planctopirus hydrillae]ODA27931.1 protein-P-II uridylyltransferase [Planctopirus hydrillae]
MTTASCKTLPTERALRLPAARQRLDELRQQISIRIAQHSTGLQITSWFSEQVDDLLNQLWNGILTEYPAEFRAELSSAIALIAVGGTGRGDLAPYSDIDLLIVHRTAGGERWHEFAAQFVRDCWDAGLKLGHSTRSIPDAIRMARDDTQFATSLLEARLLVGHKPLFDDLMRKFQWNVVRGRLHTILSSSIAERDKEQAAHGATNQELEPDVKRSPGGLRDIHLIRWLSQLRTGSSDPEALRLAGLMTRDELLRLVTAYDYLLSIRLTLHLAAGRANDILTRSEQVRIAQDRGIEASGGQLAVEKFMQEYFRHTSTVSELATRLVRKHLPSRWQDVLWRPVVTHRVDTIYRISPDQIDVPRRFRNQLASLEDLLRLYWSAAMYKVPFADDLEEFVSTRTRELPETLTVEAGRIFLDILSRSRCVSRILRSMYRTGVLELVLPCFRHVRCLLQFNQYHQFTVDEHTLRAIEAAESFAELQSPLGEAFREIRHRDVLFLALLLHDAGKGYEEDHSEVGRRLAIEAAQRFRMASYHRDTVVFLVHKHLMMAHLAFRRDTTDPDVLLRFTHEVGTVDRLRMLYVLTAADITGVGPGVWNEWKAELLDNLFSGAMQALSGNSDMPQMIDLQSRVLSAVVDELSRPTTGEEKERIAKVVKQLFTTLPRHYLQGNSVERISSDLRIVMERRPDEIHISGRYEPETNSVEYRIITRESVAEGCFHKIAGALTSQRMEILSAQISTTTEGVIIDSFRVNDIDHSNEVPQFRLDEVCRTIRSVLTGETNVNQLVERRRRTIFSRPLIAGQFSDLPEQVLIDNESSERCTIVDIFAHDRPGLLYSISRQLFELELSIVLAKISTHLDQVVDVFYITDKRHQKISDPERLQKLELLLHECISRVNYV